MLPSALNLTAAARAPHPLELSRAGDMQAQVQPRAGFAAAGVDWSQHVCQGTVVYWSWLRGLRITTRELFEQLKARPVLTVPGEYFFLGHADDWPHRHECLRINIGGPTQLARDRLADHRAGSRASQPLKLNPTTT
jgi:hypothetical protein